MALTFHFWYACYIEVSYCGDQPFSAADAFFIEAFSRHFQHDISLQAALLGLVEMPVGVGFHRLT